MATKTATKAETTWTWKPGPPPVMTTLDAAFGNIDHLPPWSAIPDEFKRWGGNEWERQVDHWFCMGADRDWIERIRPKDGIDRTRAITAAHAALRSFAPKHEHKIAGVAYLLSLWFDDPALAPSASLGTTSTTRVAMRRLLHWCAHRLHLNLGRVHSWTTPDGVSMIGFKCSTCGLVAHAEPLDTDDLYERIVAARVGTGGGKRGASGPAGDTEGGS